MKVYPIFVYKTLTKRHEKAGVNRNYDKEIKVQIIGPINRQCASYLYNILLMKNSEPLEWTS